MIIRGQFQSLSLAVYGSTASDEPKPSCEPRRTTHVEHTPLSPLLDPSNCVDPTSLARSLLPVSDAPVTLELITRLMFCLKPANEDWEKPTFPHLYADLDEFNDASSVDLAIDITSRPVSDEEVEETLRTFALNVADIFNPDVSTVGTSGCFVFNHEPRTMTMCDYSLGYCHNAPPNA